MVDSDQSIIDIRLNEILCELRHFVGSANVRQTQSEQAFQRAIDDVSSLRSDQNDLEEKLDCVIYVMQHDMEDLRSRAAASAQSIADLLQILGELKKPVADIMALRSRAAGLILGIGIVGSAALWLVEPFYRWFVEHQYLKQ